LTGLVPVIHAFFSGMPKTPTAGPGLAFAHDDHALI
jgi:hypothetical protein